MSKKVADRRVERSRRLLRQAFVALIPEKGYEALTVQDIIDRADVGRSTFYAHFESKEDMLLSGLDDLRNLLKEHGRGRRLGGERGRGLGFSLVLLEHVRDHRRLYSAMVGRKSGALVRMHVERMLTEVVRDELRGAAPRTRRNTSFEITIRCVVGAFLCAMTYWLDHDLPCSVEELDEQCRALILPGLPDGLSGR